MTRSTVRVSWSIFEIHGISIIPINSHQTQVYQDIFSANDTKKMKKSFNWPRLGQNFSEKQQF